MPFKGPRGPASSRSSLRSTAYSDFKVDLGHINKLLGINVDIEKVKHCAQKMGLVMKSVQGTEMVMEVKSDLSELKLKAVNYVH